MAIITCSVVQGNGTCYSIPSVVFNLGEQITIYATPASGESLDDLQVYDSNGYAIAITPGTEVYLSYNPDWGDVSVYAYFTGSPPPPPPPPPTLPPWLVVLLGRNKNRKSLFS